MMSALDELLQRGNGVATNRHALDIEGELLLGKASGRIVVLESELCACDAEIVRRDIEP